MIDMKLPQLGDRVEDCLVTAWLKKVGETITRDEPLLEVTTDKVTIEIPSEYDGVLSEIIVKEGQKIKINETICRIESIHPE